MKMKDGLIIKQIDDEFILIDSGKVAPKFNGMIKLNATSKDVVDILSTSNLSFKELISKLLIEYDVDESTLIDSIKPILIELANAKVLLNYNEF